MAKALSLCEQCRLWLCRRWINCQADLQPPRLAWKAKRRDGLPQYTTVVPGGSQQPVMARLGVRHLPCSLTAECGFYYFELL